MRINPIIVSVMLAGSVLGYGFAAAQMSGTNPCTASNPCAKICGDHPCAPGEVYMPGGANGSKTNSSSLGTTAAKVPAIATQVNIGANATAVKSVNGTSNGTSYLPPPMPQVPSPAKQVASGTAPADVKCQSGLQLVLNKYDSRPACVTADVMAKLVARGWAAGTS